MYNIKLYYRDRLLKVYVFADLFVMLEKYSYLKAFLPETFKIVRE